MTYFEILVEGGSDVPALREVLVRKFGLTEGQAIEETECWFIADEAAVRQAFSRAKTQRLRSTKPDAVVGAWELLADALKIRRDQVTGAEKFSWATAIAPHLNLESPRSPSLHKLIQCVDRELGQTEAA